MKKTALQENVQNLVRNVRVYVIGTLFPFRLRDTEIPLQAAAAKNTRPLSSKLPIRGLSSREE